VVFPGVELLPAAVPPIGEFTACHCERLAINNLVKQGEEFPLFKNIRDREAGHELHVLVVHALLLDSQSTYPRLSLQSLRPGDTPRYSTWKCHLSPRSICDNAGLRADERPMFFLGSNDRV